MIIFVPVESSVSTIANHSESKSSLEGRKSEVNVCVYVRFVLILYIVIKSYFVLYEIRNIACCSSELHT